MRIIVRSAAGVLSLLAVLAFAAPASAQVDPPGPPPPMHGGGVVAAAVMLLGVAGLLFARRRAGQVR